MTAGQRSLSPYTDRTARSSAVAVIADRTGVSYRPLPGIPVVSAWEFTYLQFQTEVCFWCRKSAVDDFQSRSPTASATMQDRQTDMTDVWDGQMPITSSHCVTVRSVVKRV